MQGLQSFVNQQQSQSRAQELGNNWQKVADERDAQGNFLYPELYDLQARASVQSLVMGYLGTRPDGEALKMAIMEHRLKYGHSQQPINQTRLPNQTNDRSKATSAAVSVRGRSQSTQSSGVPKIPKEARGRARNSAEWAYNYLANR